MIGPRLSLQKTARDEAEKPFWISYADLMTSLMVLFLVVMIVSIIAVAAQRKQVEQIKEANQVLIDKGQAAEKISDAQRQREESIQAFESELATKLEPLGVTLQNHRIELGSIAEFGENEATLDETEQTQVRGVVKRVIDVYRSSGTDLLTRVDVEGFASRTGDYFTNLNISLLRSEELMCAVLTGPGAVSNGLSKGEQIQTAKLFAIGGRSSNDIKPTQNQSRRIELVLQYGVESLAPNQKPQRVSKAFDYNNPGNCRVA